MRKVDLIHMQLPDKRSHYILNKKYRVSLGNGCMAAFSNYKDAKEFLAKSNELLTQCLYELNELYISVYGYYRRFWFYINDDKDYNSLIQLLDNRFNLVVNKCHSINGNYFVFNHFFAIVQTLSEFLSLITKTVESQRAYNDWHIVNVYQLQLKRINDLIENWGKNGFQIQEFDQEFSRKLGKQVCFRFINEKNIVTED